MNIETENKLISKNTRPTSMRILIYDFLKDQESALSLSEIEAHFENADRITIYRTLKTFEENGIVHSISYENTTLYRLCDDECSGEMHHDNHMHFYCTVCKQTTCLENFTFDSDMLVGMQVEEFSLLAKGVCEHCLTNP